MSTRRSGHRSVLLQNGRVLVVDANPLTPAELYDPTTETWQLTGNQPWAHDGSYSVSVVGATGKALLCGGGSMPPTNRCELYDPVSDSWSSTAPMQWPRDHFAFTMLRDGRVLVAGGITSYYYEDGIPYPVVTDTAEIFTDVN